MMTHTLVPNVPFGVQMGMDGGDALVAMKIFAECASTYMYVRLPRLLRPHMSIHVMHPHTSSNRPFPFQDEIEAF